jgi:hypothetical protein
MNKILQKTTHNNQLQLMDWVDSSKLINKKTVRFKSTINSMIETRNPSIYKPMSETIAFFLLTPDGTSISGGYRTLLKYINVLIKNNKKVDLYFGNSVNNIIRYNGPSIYEIIYFISLYNEIETLDKCKFYLGFKTHKKYDYIVANAWQVADAVYLNKINAKKIIYIIQDLEYLFYPNNIELRKRVINTYKNDYIYYCLSSYLYEFFKPKFSNVIKSVLGVNQSIYKNSNLKREKKIIIAYFKNKPGRLPNLIEKIIEALYQHYPLIIFPDSYDKLQHENIININMKTPLELNNYYNNTSIGIVMSNTNPSRLGFEMLSSGLNVIEYDSEFTSFDMPNCFFKKIKNSDSILETVNEIIDMKIDATNYLKYITDENEKKNFYNMFVN